MALALFAACLSLQAPISFTEPAARLVNLMPKLAAAYGSPLDVAPAMRNEVVFIHAENVDRQALLNRIAVATRASWIKSGEKIWLTPDARLRSNAIAAARRKKTEELVKALQANFKQLTGAVQSSTNSAPTGAAPDELQRENAEARSAMDLISAMDLDAVANLESGQRLVFSSSPNRLQRPFVRDVSPLVQPLVNQQNRMAAALEASPQSDPGLPAELQKSMEGVMKAMRRRIDRPVGKIVVSVDPVGVIGGQTARMFLIGTQGEFLFDQLLPLPTIRFTDGDASEDEPGRLAEKPKSDTDSERIALSDDAKAFLAMGGTAMGVPTLAKFDKNPSLFRPDLHEPLALWPGEGLRALSAKRKRPIVAHLADSSVRGRLQGMFQPPTGGTERTIAHVEAEIADGPYSKVEDPDWIVLQVTDPADIRRQMDRASAAKLFGEVARTGILPLTSFAEFALQNPDPGSNSLISTYLFGLVPFSVGSALLGDSKWNMLRFFGSLAEAQRNGLRAGNAIGIGQLTAAQRNALEALIYLSPNGIAPHEPGTKHPDDGILGMMQRTTGLMGTLTQVSEPTLLLPAGLPLAGTVAAEVETAPGLVTEATTTIPSMIADEWVLAMMRMSESVDSGTSSQEITQMLKRTRPATITNYRFVIQISPTYAFLDSLTDATYSANAAPGSGAKLPPDLEARVARRVEQLKKSPFGMMMGAFGNRREQLPP
jgi:hypothetical protein